MNDTVTLPFVSEPSIALLVSQTKSFMFFVVSVVVANLFLCLLTCTCTLTGLAAGQSFTSLFHLLTLTPAQPPHYTFFYHITTTSTHLTKVEHSIPRSQHQPKSQIKAEQYNHHAATTASSTKSIQKDQDKPCRQVYRHWHTDIRGRNPRTNTISWTLRKTFANMGEQVDCSAITGAGANGHCDRGPAQ